MAPPPAAASVLADRVAGALWGMYIADALAMPTHWFYGGRPQVHHYYGGDLKKYERPPKSGGFPGSIMALSNTGGAGRGSSEGDIIGTVINHGKKKYWERGSDNHYHVTLEPGENTLEGEIARLAVRSLTAGGLDVPRFRNEYVDFMTKPGSHNDAYASTYHRMFFANRARGLPLERCPDNDAHNVDAIDGLIIPATALLATATSSEEVSIKTAQESVSVLRDAPRVQRFVGVLAAVLHPVLKGADAAVVAKAVGKQVYGKVPDPKNQDPVVACYIDQNFESLLHFLVKYKDFREGVLANANAGGENVHRGLVLGAILGAQTGAKAIPQDLKAGLHNFKALEKEIDAFVAARVKTSGSDL